MLRALLLLIVGLVFVAVDEDRLSAVADGAAALSSALGQDDCCPDAGGAEERDCCDVDFGRCCAPGVVAVGTALPALKLQARELDATEGPSTAPELLLRATGPPPTPPPLV